MCSSGGIGVFTFQTLFVCLSILRWYISRDNQDLAIWSLELISRIVRGDGRTGDLEGEAVQRKLPVDLEAMSHGLRSSRLLEDAALASRVFGVLMDGTRVVKTTLVVPTMM
jgi:nickel-dependent lactate racemase